MYKAVCIYIYIYVIIKLCVYIYIYIYMLLIDLYMYTYIYTYIYTLIIKYIFIYIYIYVQYVSIYCRSGMTHNIVKKCNHLQNDSSYFPWGLDPNYIRQSEPHTKLHLDHIMNVREDICSCWCNMCLLSHSRM